MVIGLFGFTFSHENMGCQALTYSFLELIRKCCASAPIEIIAFRNENSLGDVQELFPEMSFRLVKVSFRKGTASLIKEMKKCDIIFDETFGDGFSDIYFTKSVYRDTIAKYIAGKLKAPFILTPQTYGPFSSKLLEVIAAFAIRNATEVYARDQISQDYAQKISKRTVQLSTDMAFALSFQKIHFDEGKLNFGINVSGLLWKGGFSKENQFGLRTNYREYCRRLIEEMLNRDAVVHVIPHVTKSADTERVIPDGDYPICEQLKGEYAELKLAPCFSSPYEAKNYIAGLDFFVGSRMHSTIGAVSAGVKTVPFAYSRKFQGLFDSIQYPYYVDGTKLDTKDALTLTLEHMNHADILEEGLRKSKKQIQKNTDEFEKSLKIIFEEVKKK